MNSIKRFPLFLFLLWSYMTAQTPSTSFSFAPAFPVSSSKAMTPTGLKPLKGGWEAGWTFFKKPFNSKDGVISNLAFGGRISYSRWLRDSTFTPVGFLGIQTLARYSLPPLIQPINLYTQVGTGMFIGEYAFTSNDTTTWTPRPAQPIIIEGMKCFGYHLALGINWDVVEIVPMLTIVSSKDGLSAWLAFNAGMTF